MTFTGYSLEELRAREDSGELLAATDLVVDGRYEASLPERDRRWAGSSNQRFHFLTGRYLPGVELPSIGEPLRSVEVRLASDGPGSVNGWPALVRSLAVAERHFAAPVRAFSNSSPGVHFGRSGASATRRPTMSWSCASSMAPERSQLCGYGGYSSEGW